MLNQREISVYGEVRVEYFYHKILLNDCINRISLVYIYIFLENKTRHMHSVGTEIYVAMYGDINCLFTFVHSLGLREVYGFQVFSAYFGRRKLLESVQSVNFMKRLFLTFLLLTFREISGKTLLTTLLYPFVFTGWNFYS